jgi:hypothetical protein
MDEPSVKPQKSRLSQIRILLAFLILLTSPCALCGLVSLLDSLPPSVLPGAMDFSLNLFESEVQIENRTGETLYLTPITTTYGEPMVIGQSSLRQRDIPVEPGELAVLTYDAADMPLSGVVVCRSADECRLFKTTYGEVQHIDSFEALPDA